VAKELRVIYARTMDLSPGEYSNLSDATVELAWRIPADALRRVHDDLIASPPAAPVATGEGNDLIPQALGGVELVMGVSIKSDNGYTGAHEQEMVTVRVVGHDAQQLRATLEHLSASAQVEERHEMDDYEEQQDGEGKAKQGSEEEGVVVLQLQRAISDMGVSKKIMATEAIECVGRLLGLSLRAGTTTDADQALPEEEEQQRSYNGRVPDLKTTPFAQSVLAFVREVAQATTWDADEGTFPVHAILRRVWEECGDINDDDKLDEDQGGQDGGKDPVPYEIERLCGPMPFVF
jgi:hypothetical protein